MSMIRFDLSAAPRINLDEAKKGFDQGSALFVDVRSALEYEKAHVPGAISMPLKEFPKRMGQLPPNRTIIAY